MPLYADRLNLRLTRDDLRWVAVIAAHLGAAAGPFVTRSDAVRAAIRSHALTLTANATQAATDVA